MKPKATSIPRRNQASQNGKIQSVGRELIEDAMNQCSAEMLWTCSACSQTFSSKGNLKKHMNGHLGQLDYACTWCEKKFWKQEDLDGHISAKHTNIKLHVCPCCGKAMSYRKSLIKHLKDYHPEYNSN